MTLRFSVYGSTKGQIRKEAYKVADAFIEGKPLRDGIPWYRHHENNNKTVKFSYTLTPMAIGWDGEVILWEAEIEVRGA